MLKYPTGYKEFCVLKLDLNANVSYNLAPLDAVSIAFVLKGSADIEWTGRKDKMIEKHAYLLLPEHEFKITTAQEETSLYICTCDLN